MSSGIFKKIENITKWFSSESEPAAPIQPAQSAPKPRPRPEPKAERESPASEPSLPYKTEFGKLIYNLMNSYVQNLGKDIAEVETFLQNNFKNIPVDEQKNPSPLGFRAFQSYRLCGNECGKEYYFNLIAATADSKTKGLVHPSFSGLLSQLSEDELRIIKLLREQNPLYSNLLDVKEISVEEVEKPKYLLNNFSFLHTSPKPYCENPALLSIYFENLATEGIIRFFTEAELIDKTVCDLLKKSSTVQKLTGKNQPDKKFVFTEKVIQFTDFGKQFTDICFYSHEELRQHLSLLQSNI
jgi:hypothetical protein